jgi:hypothetical protein
MTELTLKEKIKFCETYLKRKEKGIDFICHYMKDFLFPKNFFFRDLNASNVKKRFPELFNMIIEVGKSLLGEFEWGNAWTDEKDTWNFEKHESFRKEKIQKLLDSLQKE